MILTTQLMNDLESQLESPLQNQTITQNKSVVINGEINNGTGTLFLNTTYNELKSYLIQNFMPIIKITYSDLELNWIGVALYRISYIHNYIEDNQQHYSITFNHFNCYSGSFFENEIVLENTSPTSNNWQRRIG